MRDIFIFTAIIGLVFAILRKPQMGILGWLWLSIMNPHKESYGWIYSMPILDIIAGATLISALINFKQAKKALFHPVAAIMVIFYLWTCLSTLNAISWDLAFPKWLDYSKTMLFVFLMLIFMNKRHWIISAVWVFILSVGFTGVKGGIFTVLTGGGARIWGAAGTTWGDNNGVSLAMLMLVPLLFAARELLNKKIWRFAASASVFFSFLCILGTQSRGGLVGIVGVTMAFFIRTKHKLAIGLLILISVPVIIMAMPDSWLDRMKTIQTHDQDKSASTRILQWKYAVQLASESPIIGNGYNARYYQPFYEKYMKGIDANRAAHSNYFQTLEEQGYTGLFIYFLLMFSAIVSAQRVSKKAAYREDLKWASKLLYFSQFSLVGYAFNGLTLSLAYLDLYYYVLAFIILLISHIREELEGPKQKSVLTIPHRT